MLDLSLEECFYCKVATLCAPDNDGFPECRACRVCNFFEHVLYEPIGFKLLKWQRRVLRDLYGTLEPDTGLRQYRRAYISVSKKNGKSFLIAGLPIFHMLIETELNPQAYGAAAAKDQAAIVFNAAARLVKANPLLDAQLRVLPSTKRIIRRDLGAAYTVLSGDGDLNDGIEPSLAIIDELHRWKTAKQGINRDLLSKGTISRHEPLEIQITTAGEINESPICWEEHEYAKQVLAGSLKSDRFYAAIWSADEQRLAKDPEYWKSREARVAANPSHEDHGGFLKDERLIEELAKAIAKPSEKPKYWRYNLNVWVQQERRAIDPTQWNACAGDWVFRPEFLDEENRSAEANEFRARFIDRECYAGLDLSTTTDLTALVLYFPGSPADILSFFWMPAARVKILRDKDHVEYDIWAEQGFLEATEGSVIDYDRVIDRLEWVRRCFDLRELAVDPHNSRHMQQGLAKRGNFEVLEIPQNFAYLSEPTKILLGMVEGKQIAHGGHPVLRWNADCLAVKGDGNDNIRPVKPERTASRKRIDGMVALIMAIARATVAEDNGSVYNRRGLLFF